MLPERRVAEGARRSNILAPDPAGGSDQCRSWQRMRNTRIVNRIPPNSGLSRSRRLFAIRTRYSLGPSVPPLEAASCPLPPRRESPARPQWWSSLPLFGANHIHCSSLYRRSLKQTLDWAVDRRVWRGQAVYIRSLFDANKDVRDPRQQQVRDPLVPLWANPHCSCPRKSRCCCARPRSC